MKNINSKILELEVTLQWLCFQPNVTSSVVTWNFLKRQERALALIYVFAKIWTP